jgi:hypothetical protein
MTRVRQRGLQHYYYTVKPIAEAELEAEAWVESEEFCVFLFRMPAQLQV